MQAEPRTLSSPATFVLKFVLPIAFGTSFGTGTLLLYLQPTSWQAPLSPQDKLMILGAGALGLAFIWWFGGSLKRVRMDDTALYVSNYSKEIAVPLTEVTDVTQSWGASVNPVTIAFRSATEFGTSVEFIPELRWGSLLGSPPVTKEIQAAVARAGGQGPGGVAA